MGNRRPDREEEGTDLDALHVEPPSLITASVETTAPALGGVLPADAEPQTLERAPTSRLGSAPDLTTAHGLTGGPLSNRMAPVSTTAPLGVGVAPQQQPPPPPLEDDSVAENTLGDSLITPRFEPGAVARAELAFADTAAPDEAAKRLYEEQQQQREAEAIPALSEPETIEPTLPRTDGDPHQREIQKAVAQHLVEHEEESTQEHTIERAPEDQTIERPAPEPGPNADDQTLNAPATSPLGAGNVGPPPTVHSAAGVSPFASTMQNPAVQAQAADVSIVGAGGAPSQPPNKIPKKNDLEAAVAAISATMKARDARESANARAAAELYGTASSAQDLGGVPTLPAPITPVGGVLAVPSVASPGAPSFPSPSKASPLSGLSSMRPPMDSEAAGQWPPWHAQSDEAKAALVGVVSPVSSDTAALPRSVVQDAILGSFQSQIEKELLGKRTTMQMQAPGNVPPPAQPSSDRHQVAGGPGPGPGPASEPRQEISRRLPYIERPESSTTGGTTGEPRRGVSPFSVFMITFLLVGSILGAGVAARHYHWVAFLAPPTPANAAPTATTPSATTPSPTSTPSAVASGAPSTSTSASAGPASSTTPASSSSAAPATSGSSGRRKPGTSPSNRPRNRPHG